MPLQLLNQTNQLEFSGQRFNSNNPRHVGRYGTSISMNDNGTLAIVTQTDKYSNNSVYAEVLKFANGFWQYLTSITVAGINTDTSLFGFDSAISNNGNYIAISAPLLNRVYVFYSSDLLVWGSEAIIQPLTVSNRFGQSVSFTGDETLYISNENSDIFKSIRSSTNDWSSTLSVLFSTPASFTPDNKYQNPIVSSETLVLVGAPLDNTNNGSVYVYNNNSLIQTLSGVNSNFFGSSITTSTDGIYLAIGEPTKSKDDYDLNAGTINGKVYIYFLSNNTYILQTTLDRSADINTRSFGASIALSEFGNFIIIGDPGYNNMAGFSYVYQRSGSSWVLTQSIGSEYQQSFTTTINSTNDQLYVGIDAGSSNARTIANQTDYTPTDLVTALDTACNVDGITVSLGTSGIFGTTGNETGVIYFDKDTSGNIQFYIVNQDNNFGNEIQWSSDKTLYTDVDIQTGASPNTFLFNEPHWMNDNASLITDIITVNVSETTPNVDGVFDGTIINQRDFSVDTSSTITTGGKAIVRSKRFYGIIPKSQIGYATALDTTGNYFMTSGLGLHSISGYADEGSLILFTREESKSNFTNGFTIDKTDPSVLLVRKGGDSGDLFNVDTSNCSVTIGDDKTYEEGSILSLKSTTQGFLPPRMTTTQRNNIQTPSKGLMVYDTDFNQYYYYNNNNWKPVAAHAADTVQSLIFGSETRAGFIYLLGGNVEGGQIFINYKDNFNITDANKFWSIDVDGNNRYRVLVKDENDTTKNWLALAPCTNFQIGNLTQSCPVNFRLQGGEIQDGETAASGTQAFHIRGMTIGQPTLSAINSNVTTTNASTVYIDGEPQSGSNQTITNAYALYINSGNVYFQDNVTINGSIGTVSISTDSLDVGSSTPLLVDTAGKLQIQNTTDSTSSTDVNSSISTDGGLAVTKRLNVGGLSTFGIATQTTIAAGGKVAIANTTDSTGPSDTNSSIHSLGGLSIAKKIASDNCDIGSTTPLLVDTAGKLQIQNATTSSDYTDTNASLYIAGGVTISKKLNVGNETRIGNSTPLFVGAAGRLRIQNTADSTSSTDANSSISTDGGLAVTKRLNVGGLSTFGTATQTTIAAGGKVAIANTTDSTGPSDTNSSIHSLGGLSIAKKIASDNCDIGSTTPLLINTVGKLQIQNAITSSDYTDTNASLYTTGGVTISKKLNVGSETQIGNNTPLFVGASGKTKIANTTDSTGPSDTASSLNTAGGLSVAKKIASDNCDIGSSTPLLVDSAGKLQIQNVITSSSSTDTNASISTAGGISIEKACNIGTTLDVNGNTTITQDSANAFVVEKEDLSDVLIIDTLMPCVMSNAPLLIDAEDDISISVAKNNGSAFDINVHSFNSNQAASSTKNFAAVSSFGAGSGSVISGDHSNVTITDAINVYVGAGPTAGTNMTLTNSYALYCEGETKITGGLSVGGLISGLAVQEYYFLAGVNPNITGTTGQINADPIGTYKLTFLATAGLLAYGGTNNDEFRFVLSGYHKISISFTFDINTDVTVGWQWTNEANTIDYMTCYGSVLATGGVDRTTVSRTFLENVSAGDLRSLRYTSTSSLNFTPNAQTLRITCEFMGE